MFLFLKYSFCHHCHSAAQSGCTACPTLATVWLVALLLSILVSPARYIWYSQWHHCYIFIHNLTVGQFTYNQSCTCNTLISLDEWQIYTTNSRYTPVKQHTTDSNRYADLNIPHSFENWNGCFLTILDYRRVQLASLARPHTIKWKKLLGALSFLRRLQFLG